MNIKNIIVEQRHIDLAMELFPDRADLNAPILARFEAEIVEREKIKHEKKEIPDIIQDTSGLIIGRRYYINYNSEGGLESFQGTGIYNGPSQEKGYGIFHVEGWMNCLFLYSSVNQDIYYE